MKIEVYDALNTECKKLKRIEKMLLATERQTEQFIEDGVPEMVMMEAREYGRVLRKEVTARKRVLMKYATGEPVADWINGTMGLGPAVIMIAGLLPPLEGFDNPAKAWKFLGLDVRDNGKSPKREKGVFAGFNSFLRAVAIARIGDPIIKTIASPYRALYDERKAHTLLTHPPIMEDGECEFCDKARSASKKKREESRQTRERESLGFDCSNMGGIHWIDGHRHADARRYMVKAVVVDLWRVENGKQPRFGHSGADTQRLGAEAAAIPDFGQTASETQSRSAEVGV